MAEFNPYHGSAEQGPSIRNSDRKAVKDEIAMPTTKNMAGFYNSLVTFYNSLVKINPLLAIQKARTALQWGPQKSEVGGGRGGVAEEE